MANTKFTRAVKKAKALYKTGRYKRFSDAVKAAYKKVGSASVGKRKTKFRQTGHSNKAADKKRTARRPGKRRSASGKTYYERRKNRSDVPFAMTGVTTGALKAALIRRKKTELANALLRVETATSRSSWLMAKKAVAVKRAELNRLQ